jgi:hypothetical protein
MGVVGFLFEDNLTNLLIYLWLVEFRVCMYVCVCVCACSRTSDVASSNLTAAISGCHLFSQSASHDQALSPNAISCLYEMLVSLFCF